MATSRSFGSRLVTSRPLRRIVPSVTVSSPAIIRSVVVFPHPEGPTSTTKLPSGICRFILGTHARLQKPSTSTIHHHLAIHPGPPPSGQILQPAPADAT